MRLPLDQYVANFTVVAKEEDKEDGEADEDQTAEAPETSSEAAETAVPAEDASNEE